MRSFLVIVAFGLLLVDCTRAPKAPSQVFPQETFPARDITYEGRVYRYRLYIPARADLDEKLPVMLYLHGSGERGTDNEGQLSGVAPFIAAHPEYFRFVIVFPQCATGQFWNAEMIRAAVAELDKTVEEFGGDPSRLYLSGFSLGGYGTWTAAVMNPRKFAAVVPMSGRLLPRANERKSVDPAVLALGDVKDPFQAFAGTLRNVPVWIFHGSADQIVPVSNSRQMFAALKAAGNVSAKYTEIPNGDHVSSINTAFSDPTLFEWLRTQHSE